jgi:hypothetical protein
MILTRFDTYIDGGVIGISVIITDISESDRRKFNEIFGLSRKFKEEINKVIEK